MELINWVIPVAGIAAVLFAIYLARDVMSRDTGTPEMVAVGDTIREGADAFVKRQYTTIAVLAIVGAVIIGVVIGLVETPDVADVPSLAGLPIGVMTGIAFLVGAVCSGVGHHRHVHRRPLERPDRRGGPEQPERTRSRSRCVAAPYQGSWSSRSACSVSRASSSSTASPRQLPYG